LPSLVLSGSSGTEVSYEVAFNISSPVDETVFGELARIVSVFVEAGGHGGFPDPYVSPNHARLTLKSTKLALPGDFICIMEAYYVDRRAFQLLRNMAGRLKLQNIDVMCIVVTELAQREILAVDVPEPNDLNEGDVYPEISFQVGIKLEGEETGFSKARRCLVEMRNSVNALHVLGITDWIKSWYLLLEAGAFAMPVGLPEDTHSICGSVTIFDENTVEISMDRFQASENAWNVLVNMIDAYCSNTSLSVSKIIID
ncbi:MAG: hypothetical protein U9R66_10380, partial [Thermodesulfobacteriota bacterium]|nr:hypothetical protein [Thermodesulfobacteriota bacterium]